MVESSGGGPRVAAVIVAAGSGTRAGGDLPKQYQVLAGERVLTRTLRAVLAHPGIQTILVVINPAHRPEYELAVSELTDDRLSDPVAGGASRQASVLAGLEALAAKSPDIVLIHDAARPFLSVDLVSAAISAAQGFGATVPGAQVTDTIVTLADGGIGATLDRSALRAVQTPQAFRFDLILAAHRACTGSTFTDDGSVAAAMGHTVHLFPGDPDNIKLTTADDMTKAARRLQEERPMISRTGSGYDVHAFGPGDHVWLCGVKVPYERGFIAHSDGDVALHALTDALFAAMADGDIGRHFPPSDMRWKGAASDQFLAFAVERLHARGGMLDLLDVTIICEQPKITPHAETMRQRVADITGVPLGHVSVKATTTERLGFTGRKEGIAAMASATIRLPG